MSHFTLAPNILHKIHCFFRYGCCVSEFRGVLSFHMVGLKIQKPLESLECVRIPILDSKAVDFYSKVLYGNRFFFHMHKMIYGSVIQLLFLLNI